jgi:hypothetical protein
MNLKLAAVVAMTVGLLLGSRAEAGVYTDDLSRCLVKFTSADDQLVFVRWVFSALTQHPALQPMSTITPEQRDAYDKNVVALFERLTFGDCRKESIDGLKYEGPSVFAAGFRVLGEVAVRGMFGDPHVAQGMAVLGKYFDKAKMSALYHEAGVPEPQATSAPPTK